MHTIEFNAPPTVAAFMKSAAFGRIIAGPVGSGKTTGCLFELFRRACEQTPLADGYRHTRFAIVRQTLKQLKDTVLKDITSWLQGMARYKVSDNTIYVEIGDVRSEWLLIPLEDAEDQDRLLSMQLTGAWLSECIEMDVSIVPPLTGRCGRYPKEGATWFGLIADTNMPSEGSDWHRFMTEPPPEWQIFFQPGGLDKNAENLAWLTQTPETRVLPEDDPRRQAQGRKYYERLAKNTNPDWVLRYVHAKFGNDPSGTAVYRDSFRPSFHVVDELEPVYGHPLIVGQDFGRDPWSIITQLDHTGALRVLGEAEAFDTGLQKHVEHTLTPLLMSERYLGLSVALIGDPAGVAKGSIYEETSFDALKRLGYMAFPAPTNDLDARIRAVEAFLLGQRNGGPAIIFSKKHCPTLIRAMSGGYRFGKTKAGQRKPTPEKNAWSHPSDALQYAALAAHGGMVTTMVAQRLRARVTRARPAPPVGAWT